MKLITRNPIDGGRKNESDNRDRDGVMLIPKISSLAINLLVKSWLIRAEVKL